MKIGVGLDVGATKVLACALDLHGEIAAEVQCPSPTTKDELVQVLAGCVEEILVRLGDRAGLVQGIGIGLPGLVDENGILHETANMHGVEGLNVPEALGPPLEKILGAREGVPGWRLVADNDATCAAVGEHAYGAGRGASDSVTVTLGTGIGGGIVAGGRVVRGQRGFGAEIGHMVVDPAGPQCGCGRRGCWEQFASGTGLAFLGQRAARSGRADGLLADVRGNPEAIRAEHVVRSARERDPGALAVVEEFGRYLALGLANLAEILDPDRIILGGGLATAGDALLAPGLASYAAGFRRGSGPRAVPVVIAELGVKAGACGAAALALGVVG